MKHTKSILALCVLPLLAGCTTDVSMTRSKADAVPAVAEASGIHQVRYRAIVHDGRGDNHTRATLDPEKGYVFSAGDLLFVESSDDNGETVHGVLYLNEDDYGKTSGVIFDGVLTVPNDFEERDGYADTPLKAVLVGAESSLYTYNEAGDRIIHTAWPKDDSAFGDPPYKRIFSTSVAQAVERYSTLTAESTYGRQSFQFDQGTCFLNFSVTLDDGTPEDTPIDAYVWTAEDIDQRDSRSGSVTTVLEDGVVKANFVAAFPGGETVLNGAVVGLGLLRTPIAFGGTESKTLEANMIYNITRTFTRKPGSISYSQQALVKSNPDWSFTNLLTLEGDGTVTYESSDIHVATVDPTTGEVTVTGEGTATITATVDDGVNYTYAGHNTASYTVTAYSPVSLDATAEHHVTSDHIGWIIGTNGMAYVTPSGVSRSGNFSVAMIAYVGDPGTADTSSGSESYRGLAIALNDALYEEAASMKWSASLNTICTSPNTVGNDFAAVSSALTGIANTTRLAGSVCNSGHTHAAAKAANAYTATSFTPSDHGCSPWFLPSTGQWFKVFQACGVTTANWNKVGWCPDGGAANFNVMQALMTAAESSFSDRYWTSTEYPSELLAYTVNFSATNGVSIAIMNKNQNCKVRPFIAF